ncbi:RNA helicase [Chryseobacterium rhizoplanae]|uniref:RNA helicase n=1 Tax=Chryseobacterium rhizoplanae TaxID=1609531 RepID=UPI001CE2EC34|nr:RNA helicase [Chryseobacterium rhizoplanae]UCA57901.1 RNA helicase [Chryseobacterium rhizoplanae]
MTSKKNEELENDNNAQEKANSQKEDIRPVCGLIMPIADTDGYPVGHWKEVKKIITSVAEEAGFRTRLVSESEDVRVIQKTIVQNVFDDDIVICDVSSKNPNVMFELGLRFAFDKAAVIIKDDETGYSFDTSPVEHINYRKDLRFSSIEQFKKDLSLKLRATFEKSKEANHSMYLQDFGKFVVKELDTKTVSENQYILEKLNEMQREIRNIANTNVKDAKRKTFESSKDIKELVKFLYNELKNDDTISSKNGLVNLISDILESNYHISISPRTIASYIEQFNLEELN